MKKTCIIVALVMALLLVTACGQRDVASIIESEISSSSSESGAVESTSADESGESTESADLSGQQGTTGTGTNTATNGNNTVGGNGGGTGGNGGGGNAGGGNNNGDGGGGDTSTPTNSTPINSEDEGFVKPYDKAKIIQFAYDYAKSIGVDWEESLTTANTTNEAPSYTTGTTAETLKSKIRTGINRVKTLQKQNGYPEGEYYCKLYLEPYGDSEYRLYFLG
jgi:Beta-propeller domains of methanol dehydrogenase type